MKSILRIATLLIFAATASFAQSEKASPGFAGTLPEPVVVPSIAKQIAAGTFVATDPDEPARMGNPKRSGANMTVPGKGLPKGNDPLVSQQQRVAKSKVVNLLWYFTPTHPATHQVTQQVLLVPIIILVLGMRGLGF